MNPGEHPQHVRFYPVPETTPADIRAALLTELREIERRASEIRKALDMSRAEIMMELVGM